MRCSMCGHDSPPGSAFCLNCGSSLAPAFGQTPAPAAGLPTVCGVCRGENPPGMKFCRSCGSALAGGVPSNVPVAATIMSDQPHAEVQAMIAKAKQQQGMPPAGPIGGGMPPPGPIGGGMPPAGPIGGGMPPAGPMGGMPPAGPVGGAPRGPSGAMPAGAFPQPGAFPPPGGNNFTPPTLAPEAVSRPPTPARPSSNQPLPGTVTCPRCGTATPASFSFCQQCGLNLQEQGKAPSGSQPAARAPSAGVDAQGATIAADVRAPNMQPRAQPAAATGPAWGTAVLVNRDGSDGQRYPLAGEYLIVGRMGADIEFSEDRFLARQHARFERGNDGSVKVVPMDLLNGVFRKADAPVDLVDGTTVLVGREVLRFERVEGEESKVQPLVRHGVALFGSPPREPWGRLMAVIPSGGYRDVRHLSEKEIVLGREEGDIVFRDDAFMSRRHAAVTWDGKKAQITDLGSSNGTFVRLAGPTTIKHGDHVRMGDQLLRIELGK